MIPPIKWTGSKRGQSKEILSYFPQNIDTYYEPFCGGASIMLALLNSSISINKIICSDINNDLINLWFVIKNHTDALITDYSNKWNKLKESKDRNGYYMQIRANFNNLRSSFDFFFLNRTCFNGLIRYNNKNQFNSPFHFGRDGILPAKIKKILLSTALLLKQNSVEFICRDYQDIKPNDGNFLYLDPPYFNTKGLYSGGIDFQQLISYLRNLKCKYILSYDGNRNEKNYCVEMPKDIYTQHVMTKKSKSGFGKLKQASADVQESLYIK